MRGRTTGSCQRCHCRVQVPQNLGPDLSVSFETGFPFCRLLRLAGRRWRYCSPCNSGSLLECSWAHGSQDTGPQSAERRPVAPSGAPQEGQFATIFVPLTVVKLYSQRRLR
jgi:hypothetical protein